MQVPRDGGLASPFPAVVAQEAPAHRPGPFTQI